ESVIEERIDGIIVAEQRGCTLSPRVNYMKEIAGDSSCAQLFSIVFSAHVAIQAPHGLNALALALYTLTICGIYLRTLSLLSIIVPTIAIAIDSI
ncbi:MAG TPA: hypothetical protein VJS18_03345, partial [Paraburkholderia sp.]|nr:hypothetical protein [Paraburkholderia sp.]